MNEGTKEATKQRSEINLDCQQRSCRTRTQFGTLRVYRAFGIHYLKGGTNDASSNEGMKDRN